MRALHDLTRRQMLEMTAAAGGLLLVSRFGPAVAQTVRRIESMAPELAGILDATQPIVELAKGFGGDIGPAEGPLWWKEGGYLLFNDINAARRMKYTPRQGVAVAMEKTNEANGLTRDLQGRIISAEHLTRRVTRTEADGSITVVANSFQGKRLLRPNDVVVKSDGAMYFTDPGGPLAPDQWDVTSAGVYRVSADLGSMSLLTDEMVGPNGIAFSPDERILYVSDARQRHIKAFDMLPNGVVAKQTSRVFADLAGRSLALQTASKWTAPAMSIQAARAGSTSSMPRARGSAASSTARPRRPTWPSVATTGRRSISPPGRRSTWSI